MSRITARSPQPPADGGDIELTSDQRASLDLTRNRVISASAGTGKTHTLTELYLALLEGRLTPGGGLLGQQEWLERVRKTEPPGMFPRQIAVVTFTRKAAAELLERAQTVLAKELRKTDLPPELQEHLRHCWEELPGAPVSTIDAFCARLLREAGARSPAPAAFTVLEPDEANEALDDALTETAALWVEKKKDPAFSVLAREWGVFGEHGLVETSRRLLGALRTRGEEPAALIAKAPAALPLGQLQERVQAFQKAVTGETPVLRSKPKPALLGWFDGAARCTSLDELRLAVLRLPALFYGSKGERLKWAEVNDITEPSAELLRVLHAPFVRALAAYLAEARAKYDQAKRAGGVVDFHDLLFCARELLSKGASLGRYELILIDEFQDTNRLQQEVLWRVAYGQAVPSGGVKLAVVGDRKQSIYRFRGADVSVMQKVEEDPAFAVAPLRETLRSRKQVVEFLNALFESVWPAGGTFHYDDRHRMQETNDPARHGWNGPAGELLVPDDKEEAEAVAALQEPRAKSQEPNQEPRAKSPTAAQRRMQQARAIARRIRCLVNPREDAGLIRPEVWDKDEKGMRAVRYGDIAILARSVKNLRIPLQLALAEMNIPFRMLGGLSFYTRQEVLDIVNLLACAAYPHDDLALAGLLRSPLAGLSDGGLWRLRMSPLAPGKLEDLPCRRAGSLRDSLSAAAADPAKWAFCPADAEALRQADALLREIRAGCGRRTAAELIDAACRMTGFLGILALQPQGELAVAAVRRVIELSRRFEGRGVKHLSDFVRWLREKADAEWADPGREGESDLEPDAAEADDAVKIGTIHSAKGLEFPIVILADIGVGKVHTQGRAFYGPEQGLGLKLGARREGVDAAGDEAYEQARADDSEADDKERCRLLYVALTRARDYLILIGENVRNTQNEQGNWRNIIRAFLEAHPQALAEVKYNHPALVAVTPEQPAAPLVFTEAGPVLVPELEPAASAQEPAVAVLTGAAPRRPGRLARRDLRVSVTALAEWLACPRRAALKAWFGDEGRLARPVSAEDGEPLEPDELDEGDPDARALGIAAHAVLEAAVSAGGCDIEAAWAQAAAHTEVSPTGQAAQDALRAVKALLGSPWGQALLRLPADRRLTEQAFRYAVPVDRSSGSSVTLAGKIDLLCALTPGRWEVFDYKLAAVPAGGHAAGTCVRYAWQAWLYGAVAAQVLHVGAPLTAAVVFLLDKQPHAVTPAELGAMGEPHGALLEALLRAYWESQAQLAPLGLEKQVWLPLQPAPAARALGRCAAEECPFLERCFGNAGVSVPAR